MSIKLFFDYLSLTDPVLIISILLFRKQSKISQGKTLIKHFDEQKNVINILRFGILWIQDNI